MIRARPNKSLQVSRGKRLSQQAWSGQASVLTPRPPELNVGHLTCWVEILVGLDFALKREAAGWNAPSDRHLAGGLSEDGWGLLFFEILGCPTADPFVQGEDLNAFRERYETRFRQAIPDYPMLARISDYYNDVWYNATEVHHLRSECEHARALTTNSVVLNDLDAVVGACEEAIRSGLGLFLIAD